MEVQYYLHLAGSSETSETICASKRNTRERFKIECFRSISTPEMILPSEQKSEGMEEEEGGSTRGCIAYACEDGIHQREQEYHAT